MEKTSTPRAGKPKARPPRSRSPTRQPRRPRRPAAQGGRLDDVLSSLRRGRSATVDGAWGSSAALAAAALAKQTPRTLLVTIAHPRDVDGWLGDLESFSGLRRAAVSRVGQPAGQGRHRRGRRPTPPRTEAARIRRIAAPDPRHLPGADPARPRPDAIRFGAARAEAGETCDLEALAAWLVERGYQPAEAVELPGEFSRRGGILDVYSPDAEAPYRVEFFGAEIESIRQFAPETQRSLGAVTSALLMGITPPEAPARGTPATSAITSPPTPGRCSSSRTSCTSRASTTTSA